MITYIEFLEEAKNKLRDHLPQDYRDVHIQVIREDEQPNAFYDGLSVRMDGSDAGICLDLCDIYQLLDSVEELPSALDVVADRVVASIDMIPINLEDISYDREYFRRHVGMHLVNRFDLNAPLESMPHREIDDMVLLFRIYVPQPDGEYISAPVTYKLMSKFETSEDDLYDLASVNTQEMWPLKIEGPFGLEGNVYQAYGSNAARGSSCIYYPDFIKQAGRIIGGNFYILPFSLPLVIIVKDSDELGLSRLRDMSFKLATTVHDSHYKLTKNVYYCNVKEGTITKAGEYVN